MRLLLSILAFNVFSAGQLYGQLELHDHSGNYPLFDNHIDSTAGSMANFDSFKKSFYIVNTGSTSISVSYNRVRNYHTQGWTEQIADDLLHFNVTDSATWNRPMSPGLELTIPAGDSSVFQPEVFPNTINGCSIYTYYITDNTGFKHDSVRLSMTLGSPGGCTLGLPQFIQHETKVYPNPATEQLNIYIESEKHPLFSLFDINGKTVINNHQLVKGQNSINVIGLDPGIYFYVVKFSNQTNRAKKVVIL